MTSTSRTGTYLGLRPAVAIATGLAALTIGAAVGLAIPTPLDRYAPCGYVVEGDDIIPASCATAVELDARAAAIRDDRAGMRWNR